MPGSVASLDSLSSPSPSPPPGIGRSISQPTTGGTGAGLDSDSELSELTEDEQEIDNKNVDIMQEDSQEDDGARHRPTRRGGRKKRGGMVPAPMWDWAYKAKKSEDRATTGVEEEEEEEMAGPPTAMEEEEDEDEDRDSAAQSLNGNAIGDDDDDDDDPLGEDQQDNDRPASKARQRANLAGDDEVPDVNDRFHKSSSRNAYTHNRRGRSPSKPTVQDDPDDSSRSDDEEMDDDNPVRSRQVINSADASDNEDDYKGDEDDDGTESEEENPDPVENDGDVDMLPVLPGTKSGTAAPSMGMDVTAPPAAAVGPIAAAAAASSIMAGSSVLDPPSPTPSSSGSSSPSSSRSASPAPAEHTSSAVNGHSDTRRKRKNHRTSDSALIVGDAGVSETLDVVNNGSKVTPPDLDPDPELIDRDGPAEEPDADQELELDLELESDLQPAHRAEALDVLATIELKFALLRERVYVEKMEGLAWEENLVSEGSHPELLHLQTELSKRRDKRLELASRKRTYETANVTKRCRTDEEAVWSWWKFSRDELQTDLIAETNRKRRKLERERRAIERPQPVRRIPAFLRDNSAPPSLRQIAKTISFPTNHMSSIAKKRDAPFASNPPLVAFPDLVTLSSGDVAHDLEYLYQNRRAPIDMLRMPSMNHGVNIAANVPFGPPVPTNHGFDAFIPNGATVDGPPGGSSYASYPSGSRMPPPPIFSQSQFSDHSLVQGYPVLSGGLPGSRQQHHPLPSHNHSPQQFTHDRDMSLPGLGPGLPHPQHAMQQSYLGITNHSYPPQMHLGMSRPISPVHISGNVPGGISGPAIAGGAHNSMANWGNSGRMSGLHQEPKPTGGNEWNEGRRREMRVNDELGRDRENQALRDRDREKDKFRERSEKDYGHDQHEFDYEQERERDYNAQQMKQTHRHPSLHPHQHLHSGGPPHHHTGQHHPHRHHHHVVHHHHPQQSTSGPNGTGALLPGHPGVLSPRGHHREFESGHPHPHPGPAHTDIAMSSKSVPHPVSSRKREDNPSLDYLEPRSKHGSRPSSTHPPYDDRDRPIATPFAMAPSTVLLNASNSASAPLSGHPISSAPSPRYAWPQTDGGPSRLIPLSNPQGLVDRHNSPGLHRYSSSSSHPPRPPEQSRHNSSGLSPPRARPPPPSPSSSLTLPTPLRSPTRFPPPSSVGLPSADTPAVPSLNSSHTASATTSPLTKPHLPLSPPSKLGIPRLSGPGQTAAPSVMEVLNNGPSTSVYNVGSRTSSPLVAFSSSSAQIAPPRSLQNPGGPTLPLPKMNAIQLADGS